MAKQKRNKFASLQNISKPSEEKGRAPKIQFDDKALSTLVKNIDTKLENGEDSTVKRGKKRTRDGVVLDSFAEQQDRLKQEILSLGGTDEDYDLVAGLDSASEIEVRITGDELVKPHSRSKKLHKEMSQMIKDIGVPEDVSSAGEDAQDQVAREIPIEDGGLTSNHGPAGKSKGKSKMCIYPQPDWYNVELPSLPALPSETAPLSRSLLDRIHKHATHLLETENDAYKTGNRSSSSQKFYTTMATSGTLDDKIAALTLAIQESPLHNMKSLESLVNLAGKRSRGQAINVLRALKDIFAQGSLLPSDRRLKAFATQPYLVATFAGHNDWTSTSKLPEGIQPAHLVLWAFESWLKDVYFEILKILETWCNDEIEFARRQSLSYVYELLEKKPEQESNLLRLLVNKLGDPDKKIASRTSYLILKLEETHPRMKSTIIGAIQSDVLFRPGQSQHAKYYAIITLNQTVMSSREEEVASKLLDIYFSMFVGLLRPTDESKAHSKTFHDRDVKGQSRKRTQKHESKSHVQEDEMRERSISAVLTGVNRAYPYTNSDSGRLSKHIDTLYKITHSSNFNTSIQALMLIQQLSNSHQVSTERFFRTLYESLLDPRVLTTSKQTLYMNLLHKALKEDINVNRVKAFVKRIVQILNMHEASFIYGSFHLLKEIEKAVPSLATLINEPERHGADDDEEVFRDVPENDVERDISSGPVKHSREDQALPKYDPRKRDPSHAGADTSCLWEILPFLSHFHPSVAVGASHVVSDITLEGKPDLTQHTLKHFLDRFVYRNPKSSPAGLLRGGSIMQPLAAASDHAGRLARPDSKKRMSVNTEAFWLKKAEDVAAEDVFFHQYFSNIGKAKKASAKETKKAKKVEDSDAEEGENEDEIWDALVHSRPELEADESDNDLDMDDLESEFERSDEDDESNEDDEAKVREGQQGSEEKEQEVEGMESAIDASAAEGPDLDFSDLSSDLTGSEERISDAEEDVSALPSKRPSRAAASSETSFSSSKKRRRLKQLPTFASAEDYATMLEDDNGEDLS